MSSLDRDWNALASAVCGSARGMLACETPVARALGRPWVDEFRETLGDWRAWRDDFRQTVLTFGLEANSEIDGWRAELERFRGDAQRASGPDAGQITATPRAPNPSPLDALGRGVRDVGMELARPIGFVLGALAGLYLLSTFRR